MLLALMGLIHQKVFSETGGERTPHKGGCDRRRDLL